MSNKIIQDILQHNSFDTYNDIEKINNIGYLFDEAVYQNKIEWIEKGISILDTYTSESVPDDLKFHYHFIVSNAWAGLERLQLPNRNNFVDFNSKNILNEILNLRYATRYEPNEEASEDMLCMLYTNMGNALSNVGRFAGALEYYNKVLDIAPDFGMAYGNKGNCMACYTDMMSDTYEKEIIYTLSLQNLSRALSLPLDIGAKDFFKNIGGMVASKMNIEKYGKTLNLRENIEFDTLEEECYIIWCLEQCLFLNILNDMHPSGQAASDNLMLCPIVLKREDTPFFHGYFNQIIQEFVSARYLLWEALSSTKNHFSDENVSILNTFDTTKHSLSIEKIKFAFKTFYSIFDKIAYFLYKYLNLEAVGKKEKGIYFKKIWYKKEKIILDVFLESNNIALRALYWTSKDLFDDDIKETTQPDAQEIDIIRNHLEHKFIKIKEIKNDSIPFADNETYSITVEEFTQKTIKVAKLVREAIIYLSFAVQIEEQKKVKNSIITGIVPIIYPQNK